LKQILAVVKDPGGTAAVLPVVDELKKRGHKVNLVANGKADELLAKGQRDFFSANTAEAALGHFGTPDALITSMCSGGGVGRDLVPLLRGKIPTVAVQDQWGARLNTDWADIWYRPDYLVVGDEVARDIVLRAWPDYLPDWVVVMGYPALDALAGFDRHGACRRVCELLGISGAVPLFYFSGQVQASSCALRELLHALEHLALPCTVAAAMHPRMDDADKPAWEQVIREHARLVAPLPEQKPSETELVAAAHATVSMFGSALTTAAALHKPAISLMYPGSAMQERYLEVTGQLMSEHPLVTLGAVAGPRSFEELVATCKQVATGELQHKLLVPQIKHVSVGDAAARIASLVSAA
jgi:hypothetical protein